MKYLVAFAVLMLWSNNLHSKDIYKLNLEINNLDTNIIASKLSLQRHMIYNNLQSKQLLNDYYTFGYVKTKQDKPNREYPQSLKLSNGYSLVNTRSNIILKSYQDTSSNVFTFNQSTPIISFTHGLTTNSIFSLSYTIGYQKSEISMNKTKFASNKFVAFINPSLTIFRNSKIETYFQLKVGAVYDDKKMDRIESITIAYLLPGNLKFYTGFTPLGISVSLSNKIDFNFEWSLWSYETFGLGLKYNFKNNPNY